MASNDFFAFCCFVLFYFLLSLLLVVVPITTRGSYPPHRVYSSLLLFFFLLWKRIPRNGLIFSFLDSFGYAPLEDFFFCCVGRIPSELAIPNTTLLKFPTAWSLGRGMCPKMDERAREGARYVDTGTRKDSLP